MSITITSFLKLSPQPPAKATQLLLARPSDRSLPSRCAVGIACAAIVLDLTSSMQNVENIALAIGDPKWSNKRACPAWQMNSLETIVPENLPRPSSKRRWEIVGFDSSGPDPAAVRIRVLSNGNGCFSM